MIPLSLLKAAIGQSILVELKDGTTFNGVLLSMDTFMNINLGEVVCTSREGDKFWQMREAHIRGTNIKYFRIPEEVVDNVKDDEPSSAGGKRGGRGRGGAPRGAGAPRGGGAPRGRGDASGARGGASSQQQSRGGSAQQFRGGSQTRGGRGGGDGNRGGRGAPRGASSSTRGGG